jgi:hypothetical protein
MQIAEFLFVCREGLRKGFGKSEGVVDLKHWVADSRAHSPVNRSIFKKILKKLAAKKDEVDVPYTSISSGQFF